MPSAVDRLLGLLRRKPKAVIFDIDGTLASVDHRAHFVDAFPKEWSSFHGGMSVDAPIPEIVDKAKGARKSGKAVILLSLRPERFRAETAKWMADQGIVYDEMHLRPEGTYGIPGPEMKRQIYRRVIEPRFDVEVAYDDYDPVLEMWGEEGVPAVKVYDPALSPIQGRPAKDPKNPLHRPTRAYIPPHPVRAPSGSTYIRRGHWRQLPRRGRFS